ncbi:MAG TPA: choice-of-anchor tandem repeat GloVer-containing protein [Rhizomicrobium sp.]|jgi:uncharacterized repeat protein (TIGR03803 family)|nr:choice-of-anchor tandem repeat GloVer-containing protein [Rhizomicrobium sp.]
MSNRIPTAQGLVAAGFVLSVVLSAGSVQASSGKILYSFCSATNCTDGTVPQGALALDGAGNLYGTTSGGGAHASGAVFRISPTGKETVLYSFCVKTNCADGSKPTGGVIFDSAGNLLGTTGGGGTSGNGTVFRLSPKGALTVLYSFAGGADGKDPLAAPLIGSDGTLFGTTYEGGAAAGCGNSFGCGTVFGLSSAGKEKVLYAFCKLKNCADGAGPAAAPIADSKGNLYGTTLFGGNDSLNVFSGDGLAFKLSKSGQETVLHAFCAEKNCTDGITPVSSLVASGKKTFFGETMGGGAALVGTLFKMTSKGKESVVYSFDRSDGLCFPEGNLVMDKAGHFYGKGLTENCLSEGEGTNVFQVTPAGQPKVLYTFFGSEDGGAFPQGGFIADDDGNLYGATQFGGANSGGAVFKVEK